MDFYDVIRKRRSFRSYDTERTVPEDAIARISEAVRLAPTACNNQPYKLLLIRNPALKQNAVNATPFAWLSEAPVLAVVLGNETAAWRRREGDSAVAIDAAIVMEHFVLSAAAEGLGTCWICAFERAKMDRVLNVPEGWSAVAVSPLGYAKENSCRPFSRKELSELIEVID